MFDRQSLQLGLHVGWVAKRCPKNTQPLVHFWQTCPFPNVGIGICLLCNPVQEIASFRADVSLVPNLRFPSVDSDVTMVEQLLLNSRVRHTHPRRFSLGVDVVQKSEDFFGRVQPSLSGQRTAMAQGGRLAHPLRLER